MKPVKYNDISQEGKIFMDELEQIRKVKRALLSMQRHPWEQGVAMQAMLELGDLELVTMMALEAAYRSIPDGRVAIVGDRNTATDPCAAGEALLFSAEYSKNAKLQLAAKNLLSWAMRGAPRNRDGIVYHFTDSKQFWVDSCYMLPPFLAAAGEYQEAMKQLNGYWNRLYLPDKKLLAHMWSEEEERYLRADAWGVGNGWALAGMARVRSMLPITYEAERKILAERMIQLISEITKYMTPEGFFHDVIDQTSSFVECNLTQMLAYTLYRGMNDGWLTDTWKTLGEQLYQAISTKIDSYGYVQDVCGEPFFDKPGVAPEGQAFYLMLYSQRQKYYTKNNQ